MSQEWFSCGLNTPGLTAHLVVCMVQKDEVCKAHKAMHSSICPMNDKNVAHDSLDMLISPGPICLLSKKVMILPCEFRAVIGAMVISKLQEADVHP